MRERKREHPKEQLEEKFSVRNNLPGVFSDSILMRPNLRRHVNECIEKCGSRMSFGAAEGIRTVERINRYQFMRLADFKGDLLLVEARGRCGNESQEGHEAAIPASHDRAT